LLSEEAKEIIQEKFLEIIYEQENEILVSKSENQKCKEKLNLFILE